MLYSGAKLEGERAYVGLRRAHRSHEEVPAGGWRVPICSLTGCKRSKQVQHVMTMAEEDAMAGF